MTVERVPEMRERYGDDAMFLIGGSLLAAGDAPRTGARVRRRGARTGRMR